MSKMETNQNEEILVKKYKKSVLTLKISYKSEESCNYFENEIVTMIEKEIEDLYENYIIYKYSYNIVMSKNVNFVLDVIPSELEVSMINIQNNHILGKCIDMDILYLIDNEVKKINLHNSDEWIMKEVSKYFKSAHNEYLKYIETRDNISYRVSQEALNAMINEVSAMPSFGLVSPTTMGSHKDMDYYTFLKSSFAITPYIREMIKVGYSYKRLEEIFKDIRKIGVECEKEMFKATDGVNTHKGMIFLMGIISSVVGKVLYDHKQFEHIQEYMKEMVKNILDDFKNIDINKPMTHGEKLYINHGFTGIRGEIKDGLTVVFNDVLPKYELSVLKNNDLNVQILLELMSKVEDSTIVHRHNINTLKNVKKDAKEILKLGGMKTEEGRKKAFLLEKRYIEEYISPGGSADLLAIIIFLRKVKGMFF